MSNANYPRLEHLNITVPDARKTAATLQDIFGWHVRWEGEALNLGYGVHVGTQDSYVALYSPAQGAGSASINKNRIGHLNHIGVVVSDLNAVERKVVEHGYKPVNHGDYEPGRRFYFHDENGVEFEVVSYA